MERLSFKTYTALKATKLGLKSYQLRKSITEYVWSFSIYTVQGMALQTTLSVQRQLKLQQ